MSSSSHQAISRHRQTSVSSAERSSRKGKVVAEPKDFTSPTTMMKYFEPTAATASMLLYGQGSSVVVAHHDSLTIERRFSRHSSEVQLLAVDNQSEIGAGRLVVSYDVDMTAIVWDLMTGDEVARFASYENLTCAAWMRNGNVAFGNSQGNIILFEPTTSEHISARTIDQIMVTAIAPAADCRTFAIGYQNGSLLIATLQPRFTILHNLSTSRAPSPIVNLSWHASSSRQKADMLAVQTNDGDLRVWSVAKSSNGDDPAKVVRILKRTENYQNGPNWMGWSKNGRIIQYSDSETLSWDVRTKHVTYDSIPTLEHVRGLAVYGPGATLFTLGGNNTVQQFDLNTPSLMVANVQHPANLLPPSPPVSIEEQVEQGVVVIATDSDSVPISSEISESDEDHMSPLARIARGTDATVDAYDQDRYMSASPVSSRSQASTLSKSSAGSSTHGRHPPSVLSRGMTENTYISTGSSMRSSVMPPFGDKDAYSISSVSSASITSSSHASRRHRPSRLRNEVPRSPDDNRVHDLFKFTRSRLHDVPYKRLPLTDQTRLTPDDLRRQMLSIVFGWNKEIHDLVRDEMSRHPNGSSSRILLAKWLGDIDADIMTASSENMTSSDWMLLALSGIGGQASQHKLGRAYVQRLLESNDIHAAATIMIGMGDHNDAIEIYVSHKRYMEALILLCLFFPNVWERQAQIIKKWGEFAVLHGQQQLAIRCFACTGQESTEPWTSPSAVQVTFQSLDATIPEVLSPPLSPPGLTLGPQRSIAKTSALKLITSFDDQKSKSKFFAAGDGGQTPIAAGVTPIAESAVSPGGRDPTTAFLKPSNRSAYNTPASARATTPGGFGRPRLPSIGEVHMEVPASQTKATRTNRAHSRKSSQEDQQMSVGLSLARAATASPMMMRDSPRKKQHPPPSPSPESFAALMASGRSSRNGARDRVPDGIELQISSLDAAVTGEVTSPEQSVASSTRFHWPSRRKGPASVASSVTSNSSAGRSLKSGQGSRGLNNYVHSLETAHHHAKKQRSRESSRHRQDDQRARSRDSSRNRKDFTRESSSDRGRGVIRNYTPKPAKRSPTSPIPMSPEDLLNLSTPRVNEASVSNESVIPFQLDSIEPSTARKSSQVRISSRTSSRGRRRSNERRPPALDLRGRSKSRGDGSVARSPSSPLPMSSQAAQFYGGSDDEEDLKAAIEAQELFRAKHNGSRGVMKDPSSPVTQRTRDGSEVRRRRIKTPALEDAQVSIQPEMHHTSGPTRSGDLKQILTERQLKKEAAARELEERRKSLARRPSAPPIPHPQDLSPIYSRPPTAFELPSTAFVPHQDLPQRSQTADFARSSAYTRNGNRPIIGLPATPKAMRLQFDSGNVGKPSVPPIPAAYVKSSPPSSGQPSPDKLPGGGPEKSPKPAEQESLMTLLPSTVYSPPTRPNIPRCMSAPIPEEPMAQTGYSPHPSRPSSRLGRRGSVSRKMSVPEAQGASRGIDEVIARPRHSRQTSRDDQVPPPPPPPPVLMELQHLATPPPPPPAPLPGVRSNVFGGSGSIEIVMDEDENANVPVALPFSEAVVPIIAPPAPPSTSHARGRSFSEKDNSISSRISRATERATERMRSASRGRSNSILGSRTKSPEQTSPYESVLPSMTYSAPQQSAQAQPQMVERHPRDVRAAYQQQQQQQQPQPAYSTGLLDSEMF